MKAVVFDRYGPPEVLQLRDIPKPCPKDDEVLIRIHRTTVPAEDPMIRGFTFSPLFWLPLRLAFGLLRPRKRVLGSEFAGEIEAVGKSVTRFKVGDQVYGADIKGLGACAEYKVIQENGMMLPKPTNLTYDEVASACGSVAGWNLLRDQANVQPGQKVLINGASGNIGTHAVQIARHLGAEVTGVCSTRNLDLVRSIGAAHVIDYTQEDFTENRLTYDVIFDAVSKRSFSQCKRSLAHSGSYISAVPSITVLLQKFWTSKFGTKKVLFSATGLRPIEERLALFKEVGALIAQGMVKNVVDRHYSLEQLAEAHRYVATGRKRGTVVIDVIPADQSI